MLSFSFSLLLTYTSKIIYTDELLALQLLLEILTYILARQNGKRNVYITHNLEFTQFLLVNIYQKCHQMMHVRVGIWSMKLHILAGFGGLSNTEHIVGSWSVCFGLSRLLSISPFLCVYYIWWFSINKSLELVILNSFRIPSVIWIWEKNIASSFIW